MNADGSTAASSATGPGRAALVFRLTQIEAAAAGAGELNLVPARRDERQRRDVARLALERGPDGFVKGAGPIRQIVLPGQPTFDEMLAAEFVARLLAGDRLPEGCATWAEYAKLVREGLRPGEVPLERSVEGIFLAMLNDPGLKRSEENDADVDLTLPSNEALFCRSWTRLARRVMDAAQQGVDPFTTPLLDDAEFARQRTFLARDREVYRQDVTRGQRWIVSLPDGPPEASGLLLRKPRSLLFKHWPRCDDTSPTGDGYLLLAVQWAENDWVFSTDPVHRLSLKPLWELLQTAEAEIDPRAAAAAPWFDGAPFNHTLIAAPRGRSKLPDETIVHTVKQWCGARELHTRRQIQAKRLNDRRSLLVGSLAAGVGALTFGWWNWSRIGSSSMDERHRDDEAAGISPPTAAQQYQVIPDTPNLYVLSIGVSDYPTQPLPCAVNDAQALAEAFQAQEGHAFARVTSKVLRNEEASKNGILEGLVWLQRVCTRFDLAIVTFSGHGISDPNMDFIFLPRDYDPTKRPSATGLTKADITGHLRNILCHRIVIMDTCHSGKLTADGVAGDSRERGADFQDESNELDVRLRRQIADMHNELRQLPHATVFLAACLSHATAQERSTWRHGALSLAVLEAVQGKYLHTTGREGDLPVQPGWKQTITFKDLEYYVANRVNDLTGNRQSVVVSPQGEIPLHRLPIAILGP